MVGSRRGDSWKAQTGVAMLDLCRATDGDGFNTRQANGRADTVVAPEQAYMAARSKDGGIDTPAGAGDT